MKYLHKICQRGTEVNRQVCIDNCRNRNLKSDINKMKIDFILLLL